MPVTINTGKLKIKNNNDGYIEMDAIANNSIADMQQAVSDCITEINNTAAATIATIPPTWTELSGEVAALKSAVNNAKSVTNVPNSLSIPFSSVSAAIDPDTGGNATVGARSGYTSFDRPICIDYSEEGYTYCVWVYTTNATSAASYSPTGKAYVTGRTVINPVDGTNPCFRVGIHRSNGGTISSDDATAEYAKIKVYSLTDDKLVTTGAPADAKVAGDAARAAYDEGANLIPYYKDTAEKTDATGITWNCQNGAFTLSGSTSSIFFINLAGSTDTLPFGIRPGDTVYLEADSLKSTNVYMAFRPYKDGATYGAYQYDGNMAYMVPVDATGLQVRLEVPANRTLTSAVTYKPILRFVEGNAKLSQRLAEVEAILPDNAVNLIPPFDHVQSADNDITWSAKSGEMTIGGTASSTFFTIVAGSNTSLPKGMVPGGTYLFWLNGPSGLRLSVYTWPGGSNVFETSGVGYFTIPSTATGVQIRVRVPSGQTIPTGTVVHPFVGLSIPNAAIKTLAGFKPAKSMLTIIDDDGNSKFYTKLLPIIKAKNVPIASAIICERPGVHEATMTWAQIVECYENGAEILSHSMTHLTGDVAETLTEPEIELDYRQSKHTLAAHGMPTNILVYPGNSGNNDKCVTAAEHVFDYAIHSAGNVMTTQNYFRPYYIQRYGLGIGEFVPESGQTVGTNPKTYLDACAAGNGWMVWMIHTSSGDWTDAQVDGIEAAIDYARELGIDIVTCEYALKQFVRV